MFRSVMRIAVWRTGIRFAWAAHLMNFLHKQCANQQAAALERAEAAESRIATTQAQLHEAIEELSTSQTALELERTKRISAEMLAESRRVECGRLEEFARKAEDSRNEAVTQLVEALQRANMQLIESRTAREDPEARIKFEQAKQKLREAGSNRHVHSIRKAMIDLDLGIINAELKKRNPQAKPIPTEAEMPEPAKETVN